MNKRILTVAVAALALAACSENETVEVAANRAIGFENFVDKATRAEMTNEELQDKGFAVYGGSEDTKELFKNVLVTYNAGEWTYEDTKYWMPGKTYRFAAYAPKVDDIVPTWSYDDNKLTFKATIDATNQHDLVYDVATPVTVENPVPAQMATVDFSMDHILSKLNFVIARGDIETDAVLTITDFKVNGNIYTTGSYDAGWTFAEQQAAAVEFEGTDNVEITNGTTGAMGTFYVLPQTRQDDKVTVSFKVTMAVDDVTVGTETTLDAEIDINWESDYVYTYTATINQANIDGGMPIKFTGTVNAWSNEVEDGVLNID